MTIKDGGGIGFSETGGGAAVKSGTLLVIDSTFTENRAEDGGGVDNSNGTVGIIGTTFIMNKEGERGGALLNNNGIISIANSTFSENEANDNFSQAGSAIHNLSGTVNVLNATFVGNKSTKVNSGAIHNQSVVGLQNTIFGSNTPDDCSGQKITDLGNNLSENDRGGCTSAVLTELSPIAEDNGGPTFTHQLFEGSTAINKVGACILTVDQRGFERSDGSCDSGAYEFGGAACRLLELMDTLYDSAVVLRDCQIHVGSNVTVKSTGFLTLKAGKQVLFKPGFGVEKAGRLVVDIDSSLLPSTTTLESERQLVFDRQLLLHEANRLQHINASDSLTTPKE